jgi:hypothetical protein
VTVGIFNADRSLYGGLKQKHNGSFTVDGMGLQISMANWEDDLCDFLELPSQHKFTGVAHVPTIQQGLYRQLDACVKLKILMELVGCCVSSSAMRTQIDNNIEEHQLAMANKREAEVEELKRKNEERENLKRQQCPGNTNFLAVDNGDHQEEKILENGREHRNQEDNGEELDAKEQGHSLQKYHLRGWRVKGKRNSFGNLTIVSNGWTECVTLFSETSRKLRITHLSAMQIDLINMQ